ncbi:MAG: hypothetical protein ABIH92_03185 [Nanoarchaeota archaeon]
MKKTILLIAILLLSVNIVSASMLGTFWNKLTGKVTYDDSQGQTIGPSQEEFECFQNCATRLCGGTPECKQELMEKKACADECGKAPEAQSEEETCMQQCVIKGCDEFDFNCQGKNKETCENECGMIKEPEAQSEEEQCIRDCVAKVDPTLMCGSGPEGETGNEVCQQCATQCIHLYKGPCLNDEQITEKEEACKTCEHCYGEPVMGPSGEGYECITDIKCSDASSEFGDEPGSGQETKERGAIAETVSNIGETMMNFFKTIFG